MCKLSVPQLIDSIYTMFMKTSTYGMQIPEDQWEDVSNTVLRMLAGSSYKSSKPAIFGAAPAPDDGGPRRPLGSAREGDAVALEVAAAEMAQAASTLVAIERTIMSLSEKGVRRPTSMLYPFVLSPFFSVRHNTTGAALLTWRLMPISFLRETWRIYSHACICNQQCLIPGKGTCCSQEHVSADD